MQVSRTLRRPMVVASAVLALAGCGAAGQAADPASVSASVSAQPTTSTSASAPPAGSAGSSASASSPLTPGPALVLLGHSGGTGQNSDPAKPGVDAPENSWATGENPAVDSIYQRLVARTPAFRGHVINLAKDGATIDGIRNQANTMAGMGIPADSVVLVQAVDNDIRCDGTDADNYVPFGENVTALLKTIKAAAPKAQIYLLAQWVSVQNWTDVAATVPSARGPLTGDGVCDALDAAGKQRPAAITYLQDVVDHYHQQLATACAAVAGCTTNNAALQKLEIAPADISSDGNHFTVQGHAKFAAAVWRIFFGS